MRSLLVAFLLAGLTHGSRAQDAAVSTSEPKDETIIDDSKAWQTRRVNEFAVHKVVQVTPEGQLPLIFDSKPLLNWSNPIRNSPSGAVFIWTVDDRPRMIASTYPYQNGIEQEMSSLSEFPLILDAGEGKEHRFTPGVEWKDLASMETPSP